MGMVQLLVIIIVLVALVDVHVLDVLPLPLYSASVTGVSRVSLGERERSRGKEEGGGTYATVDGIPELVRRRVKGTIQLSQPVSQQKRVRQPQPEKGSRTSRTQRHR